MVVSNKNELFNLLLFDKLKQSTELLTRLIARTIETRIDLIMQVCRSIGSMTSYSRYKVTSRATSIRVVVSWSGADPVAAALMLRFVVVTYTVFSIHLLRPL